VEGSGIGKPGTNFSPADIKYSTLGFGGIYHWDGNLKFIAYYDKVTNEKVNSGTADAKLIPFIDDLNDNVFTFRAQVKF
jgi:hypothetical protein